MRLWLSKNSEVPIREQLVTQIVLGIVSNDLKISERLPSTRDLARRYDIHANTVSAAHREGVGPAELDGGASLTGAVPLVLYGHLQHFADRIDPQAEVLVLHSASVVESMRGQTRPPADALVAIVSRWPEFLKWARTMLVAAGLDSDVLSFRDARERGWEKGLRSATFVIADSLMAPRIPAGCEVKIFRVLAESSLKEVRDYAERFF